MLIPSRKASRELGVHANTLRRWADDGKIKYILSPGGKRLYDCSSITGVEIGAKVCYCRVSSKKQKDDLSRQVGLLRERYPDHEIIEDIGSGLNFKRKGFKALLERVCAGTISEVVVAHRDRLCRFGFELVKWMVEKNGGRLVVLNDVRLSPESELANDILSIIHVFSCRMHGLRKYSHAIKKDSHLSNCATKETIETVGRSRQISLQQNTGAS